MALRCRALAPSGAARRRAVPLMVVRRIVSRLPPVRNRWRAAMVRRHLDVPWYTRQTGIAAPDPAAHWRAVGCRTGLSPHPLFDPRFYNEANADVARIRIDPFLHFLECGGLEGRAPHPLFDSARYLADNPDVARARLNPWTHYLASGWREGRSAGRLFDARFYRDQHSDLPPAANPLIDYLTSGHAEAHEPNVVFSTSWYRAQVANSLGPFESELAHFAARGARAGLSPHPLFDSAFYFERNRDVFSAGLNPLEHYLQEGWRAGRDPHPLFSVAGYLAAYKDVAATGMEPLTHYLLMGWREGRRPHPAFDPAWYCAAHAQAIGVDTEPLADYVSRGWREGRRPNPYFDPTSYLLRYADVAAAGEEPFRHFLSGGWREGREPCAGFFDMLAKRAKRLAPSEHPMLALMAEPLPARIDSIAGLSAASGEAPLRIVSSERPLPGKPPPDRQSADKRVNGEIMFDADDGRDGQAEHVSERGRPVQYVNGHLNANGDGPGPLIEGLDADANLQIAPIERQDCQLISGEVDADYYASTYPDIRAAIQADPEFDAALHYITSGWREGRNPNTTFQTTAYLLANPDVAGSGENPFVHYVRVGRREGRRPGGPLAPQAADAPRAPAPFATSPVDEPSSRNEEICAAISPEFDRQYYLSKYPDIRAQAKRDPRFDPVAHYASIGWREGRDPSADFSTSEYLEIHPDVRQCGTNPFYHYIVAGREENRPLRLPGGFRARHLSNLRTLEEDARGWRAPNDRPVRLKTEKLLTQMLSAIAQDARGMIVAISHDDYRSVVGGVQLCMRAEQEAFCNASAAYLQIYPMRPSPILAEALGWPEQGYKLQCDGKSLGAATARDIVGALATLARSGVTLDLVVHALLGAAPEFVAALCDAPMRRKYYWLHDYFSLCPGYNLLRNRIRHCGAPPVESAACSICYYGAARAEHFARMSALFECAGFSVLSPSEAALAVWERGGLPHASKRVLPHCTLQETTARATPDGPDRRIRVASRRARVADRRVRIAYLGHPTLTKGWPAFQMLLDAAHGAPDYEFYFLGETEIQDSRLNCVKVSNGEEMQQALIAEGIDVAIVWSLWPETFCLIAYEAAAAGVGIVTNEWSGNVADFVRREQAGVVLDSEDELLRMYRSGDLKRLARAARERRALSFGGVTADALQADLAQ